MSFFDDLDDEAYNTSGGGDQHAISCSVTSGEVQTTTRLGPKRVDFLLTTMFANSSESLVRRTWEDFEWMQGRLVQERAGIVVPILPLKKATNRKSELDPAMIKERQEALDRFIQRIVTHQDLVDAPSLLPFFTANTSDWIAAKEVARLKDAATIEATNSMSVNDSNEDEANTVHISAAEEAAVPQKKGMLGQWWSEKRDRMALRSKNLILEETPVESKRFEDLQNYAEHLDTCIRILAEDSKKLTSAQRNMAENMKTMGAAFTQLWGEHELSNTSSSTMYQKLGDCWTNLSKRIEHQYTFASGNFEIPLEELALDVTALKEALAKRKKVVYEYTRLVREGRKLQQRFDTMQSSSHMNQMTDAFFNLERTLRTHDALVEERKVFKELITERLTRDIDRFRVEWHEKMREVMENYHKVQAQLFLDKTTLWDGVLPVLERVDGTRSSVPTGPRKVKGPELSFSITSAGARVSFTNSETNPNPSIIKPPLSDTVSFGPPMNSMNSYFPDDLLSPPVEEEPSPEDMLFLRNTGSFLMGGGGGGGEGGIEPRMPPPPTTAPPLPPMSPPPAILSPSLPPLKGSPMVGGPPLEGPPEVGGPPLEGPPSSPPTDIPSSSPPLSPAPDIPSSSPPLSPPPDIPSSSAPLSPPPDIPSSSPPVEDPPLIPSEEEVRSSSPPPESFPLSSYVPSSPHFESPSSSPLLEAISLSSSPVVPPLDDENETTIVFG